MEPRLLSDEELAEIRDGVRGGMRGPRMLKWVEMLLADHDARVAREEKATPEGVRGRYFVMQRRRAAEA